MGAASNLEDCPSYAASSEFVSSDILKPLREIIKGSLFTPATSRAASFEVHHQVMKLLRIILLYLRQLLCRQHGVWYVVVRLDAKPRGYLGCAAVDWSPLRSLAHW